MQSAAGLKSLRDQALIAEAKNSAEAFGENSIVSEGGTTRMSWQLLSLLEELPIFEDLAEEIAE